MAQQGGEILRRFHHGGSHGGEFCSRCSGNADDADGVAAWPVTLVDGRGHGFQAQPVFLVLLGIAAAANGGELRQKLLRGRPRLRRFCTLLCVLAALACGVYLGAGLLLLSAIQSQSPAP